MESFLELCQGMKANLGRELQMKEVDFLRWMYESYLRELQNTEEIKKKSPNESKGFFR